MPADRITLTPKAARALISNALTGAGATPDNARYLTEGVLDTELSGMAGHGFHWVPSYCLHLKSGKVNGKAKPSVKRVSGAAFRVDAKNGFAHPAIEFVFGSRALAHSASSSAENGDFREASPRKGGQYSHGLLPVKLAFSAAGPVAEPVDATDLKSVARKGVSVRVGPGPPEPLPALTSAHVISC